MLYHHALAKNATDVALLKWKQGTWPNSVISVDVYQTIAAQAFPSPDSMLFDPTNRHSIAIEFKPPTETRRGILTGVGQAMAYLSSASLSYLVAPKMLEGHDLSGYLERLFQRTVCGRIPLGLICYGDDEAKELEMIVDVGRSMSLTTAPSSQGRIGRYWAKHIDLPLHGLWLILDLAYQLPDCPDRINVLWQAFWDRYLFPQNQRTTLDVQPSLVIKHDGNPLYILDRVKRKLQAQVDLGGLTHAAAMAQIQTKIDPAASGDNYYKSYKKNFFPFIGHLKLWDDNGHLTEDGLLLHRIGKIHGSRTETFKNYFAGILLFSGKHLELMLDVEELTRNKNFNSSEEAVSHVETSYVQRGLYKPSPNSVTTGTVQFLKYERIIWGQLGFLKKANNSQFIPHRGFVFDWGQITKACSLYQD